MIIEFTGSSGAGKTAICGSLYRLMRHRGKRVVAIHQDAAETSLLPVPLRDPTRFNIRTDLFLAPWVAAFSLRHPRFAAFVAASVLVPDESIADKLANIRSIWKKMGLFQYLSRREFKNTIVLVDEGLVHIAHNVLVSPHRAPDMARVEQFSTLISLPDQIIVLHSPASTAKARVHLRGKTSPRIKRPEELSIFLEHAEAVFRRISSAPRLQPVVTSVDTSSLSVEDIAARLYRTLCPEDRLA
jgi:thymidylate kinase